MEEHGSETAPRDAVSSKNVSEAPHPLQASVAAAKATVAKMKAELEKTDGGGDVVLDGRAGKEGSHSVTFFDESLRFLSCVIDSLAADADGRARLQAELAKYGDYCVESLWPEDVGDMEAEDGVTYGEVLSEDELLRTTWRAVEAYRNYVDAGDARNDCVAGAADSVVGAASLDERIRNVLARTEHAG